MLDNITIRLTSWLEDESLIRSVRESVFLKEQRIPAEIDFDDKDSHCVHAVAQSCGLPVGTGRIQSSGKMGRVAVLKDFRRLGIGTAIVNALLNHARSNGLNEVYLNAQLISVSFYEKLNFQPKGDIFPEAGIKHIRMVRPTGNR